MNYLTAIIAVPLFFAIWLFEFYLFCKYGGRIKKSNKSLVLLCLTVSTLQMISCFFWLLGFVYSKKKNADTGEWDVGVGVLSEAMEDDEEMNCFGLVGAEVLLATFQALFSLVTIYQALEVRAIYMRTRRVDYQKSEWTLTLIALGLGMYVYYSWCTAHNRRCQKSGHPKWAENAQLADTTNGASMLADLGMGYNGSTTEFESVYVPWQHHFYPIFLIFDSFFGLMLYSDVKKLAKTFSSGDARGGGNKTVRTFQKFFRFEAFMIIIGCAFAILIFVLQFMLKVKALSLLACIFCVCMYVTYAMRRVPMLMLYTQFPPFVKKFDMELDAGDSSAGGGKAVGPNGGGAMGESSLFAVQVLGTAACGKTTLFKQLRIILGGGFSNRDREEAADHIKEHILMLTQVLLSDMPGGDAIGTPETRAQIKSMNVPLTEASVATLSGVLNDPAFEEHLSTHARNMDGNPNYFLAKANFAKFFVPDYQPSDDDILKVRKKTDSLEFLDVVHPQTNQSIRFHDAPGQKEKFDQWRALKKFEVIDATIFVLSIADFNRYIESGGNVDSYKSATMGAAEGKEKGLTNAMDDNLQVFKDTVARTANKTPVIMFFNKIDLLENKIAAGANVQEHFPEIKGNDRDSVVEYFSERYKSQVKKPENITIYPTCATDQETMNAVVTQMLGQLLAKQLKALF